MALAKILEKTHQEPLAAWGLCSPLALSNGAEVPVLVAQQHRSTGLIYMYSESLTMCGLLLVIPVHDSPKGVVCQATSLLFPWSLASSAATDDVAGPPRG